MTKSPASLTDSLICELKISGILILILSILLTVTAATLLPVVPAVCIASVTIILAVLLFHSYRQLRQRENHYRKLCSDFSKGIIYQDFIQDAGGIFPGLNDAIARLDSLLDRQQVLQLSQKQAEFLALQNQINPHFLYNTLEAIRSDAIVAGMSNIADITEALSIFFRYTITDTQHLVTIRDELKNVENYFAIQQYRFGDKLSMKLELSDNEEKLLQLQCPKLFLQPVIENAIFHGLERKKENGIVEIRMELFESDLHIDVIDNGVGIEEQKLIELNKDLTRVSVGAIVEDRRSQHGGIALKNVCRRIKLLFGEQYGVRLSSIAGVGTRVEITFPATERRPSHAV